MSTPTEPARDFERRERHLDRLRTLLGLVAVTLLAMLVWYAWDSRAIAEDAVTQTQTLAQQVTAACSTGGAAEKELEAIGACKQAASATSGVIRAEVTTQVATDDQVRAAVASYLQRHPPADGRTPSQAEVNAAVADFCKANACRGADGTNGTNGTDGVNGRDATDSQVAAAVTTYCADNNGCLPTQEQIQAAVAAYCGTSPSPCVGPQGAEGPPGPVLPEYYITRPNGLGTSTVTFHCVLQAQPDAAAPPHYNCTQE